MVKGTVPVEGGRKTNFWSSAASGLVGTAEDNEEGAAAEEDDDDEADEAEAEVESTPSVAAESSAGGMKAETPVRSRLVIGTERSLSDSCAATHVKQEPGTEFQFKGKRLPRMGWPRRLRGLLQPRTCRAHWRAASGRCCRHPAGTGTRRRPTTERQSPLKRFKERSKQSSRTNEVVAAV